VIILQLHKDTTLCGIKKCMTDWLRHAKERYIRHKEVQNEDQRE